VMLPNGVHVITKRSGRKLYYWRPGRGTNKAGVSVRLPDDPLSPKFWKELNKLRFPLAQEGGVARMIEAYQISPHYDQLKPSTKREYDRYLTDCRQHLGHFDAEEIQPAVIAAIRDQFGTTPAKANAYVKAIAALFAWGRERGFSRDNPADGISKLKVGEHQPWPQWAWEISQTHFRHELKTACALALYTGQRLGDVLRMQLGDIRDDVVTVRQAKTGKTLQIPLHRELKSLVAECRERGSINLVAKTNGQAFNVDQFHAMWGREMQKPECKSIREKSFVFHGLRKSATVKLIEAGCTPKEVSSVTGMSLAMVEHYGKGADQLRLSREAIRKFERG
jgi:integrase